MSNPFFTIDILTDKGGEDWKSDVEVSFNCINQTIKADFIKTMKDFADRHNMKIWSVHESLSYAVPEVKHD
jgi:hypothetical protein